jgi:hypothetical protein
MVTCESHYNGAVRVASTSKDGDGRNAWTITMNPVAEITRLYYATTRATIQRDLEKAIDLLKTLQTEEDRERVSVFMDGLSQMRSEWGVRPAAASAAPGSKPGARKTPGTARARRTKR